MHQPHRTAAALSPRAAAAVLVALVVAYLVPGLIGHEPWKADEPYTFGVVYHMLRTGDWVVPTVGGIPFVEKPPLYYWVSWATAAIASPFLPLHDGARIASALFVVASLAATAWAARLCWGEGVALPAVVLFIATLGLESHAQKMQVDLALLAGFSVAVLGLAACARDRPWGGAVLGLGVGAGFLAKGLFAPGVLGAAAILLPLCFARWRNRRYATQLVYAAGAALPLLLIWPIALWLRSEALFAEWFWDNNLGRFAGFSVGKLGAAYEPGSWSETLPWFLFPLWIYVLGAAAAERGKAWREPGMQIAFAVCVVAAFVLAVSASMRAVYILPVIPPLVLAAAPALLTPERAAGKTLAIFSVALAATGAVVVWGAWYLLVTGGMLPNAQRIGRVLPLPFAMPVLLPALLAAIALTAGYVALVVIHRRLAAPSLALWVGTLALLWGLAMTLLVPWLDAAKGYREVFTDLARHLPPDPNCIVMDGPGESERALVEYFTGVAPRQRFNHEEECAALLWMGAGGKGHPAHAPEWRMVWSGNRRAEWNEKFELYVHARSGPAQAAR
jgi:4-amino-4-deoxy-L-arabinose transferase-like glycosyltransferase